MTVGKVSYNYGQVAYLLASNIVNLKSSVSSISVKNAPNPTGVSINEKIYTGDYEDQASRIVKYIKNNKQCPNYVTTKKSGKKIRPRLFIYCFSKIIVFYSNNKNTLPNYCLYDSGVFTSTTASKTSTSTSEKTSSSSTSLKSYLTNTGCSGMGQCTSYYCACNSLQQCFYRLTGIKVPESTIASVAGTTSSGTGHDGINTAVAWFNKKYNKNIKITWKNFSDLGSSDSARWSKLQGYISKGAVFCHILYRNQWGHYEVPKQVSGSNVIVLNSLGNSCGSGTYCGYIETRSKASHLSYIKGISQKSIAILTK